MYMYMWIKECTIMRRGKERGRRRNGGGGRGKQQKGRERKRAVYSSGQYKVDVAFPSDDRRTVSNVVRNGS